MPLPLTLSYCFTLAFRLFDVDPLFLLSSSVPVLHCLPLSRLLLVLKVRYKPPLPRRMRSDWLHGAMSRGEAEKKLRAG